MCIRSRKCKADDGKRICSLVEMSWIRGAQPVETSYALMLGGVHRSLSYLASQNGETHDLEGLAGISVGEIDYGSWEPFDCGMDPKYSEEQQKFTRTFRLLWNLFPFCEVFLEGSRKREPGSDAGPYSLKWQVVKVRFYSVTFPGMKNLESTICDVHFHHVPRSNRITFSLEKVEE